MDIDYDEDQGNPARPECMISIARTEELYEMTEKVFPWELPADGDDTRRVTPLAYLESMTRRAPIDNTADLSRVPVLTRCLHLHDFVAPTISLMMENGLGENDADEDDDLIVFDTLDDLYDRCDFVMNSVKDDPTVLVQEASFDHYEGLSAGHARLQWLSDYSVQHLVAKTADLTLYDDSNLILGARGLDASRMDAGTQLRMVAGSNTGGLLAAALREFLGMDSEVEAESLVDQIPEFLLGTKWESPYNISFSTLKEYALDVPRRAKWQRATREEGATIARTKIVQALPKLATTHQIFLDVKDQPSM